MRTAPSAPLVSYRALQPGMFKVERVERFAFYERARSCYAVVATGETAKYGNIILVKGVLGVTEESKENGPAVFRR